MAGAKSNGTKRAASASKAPASKRTRSDAIFDNPDAILGDPKSPLYKEDIDIKAILKHELAASILGDQFLHIKNEELDRDISSFQEDGLCGRHDEEWIRQAIEASGRRRAGEFDAYLQHRFNEFWGEDTEELSEDESGGQKDFQIGVRTSNGSVSKDSPSDMNEGKQDEVLGDGHTNGVASQPHGASSTNGIEQSDTRGQIGQLPVPSVESGTSISPGDS